MVTAQANCVCLQRVEKIELVGGDLSIAGNEDAAGRFGVLGEQLEHNRSPFIHGLFARQTQRQMVYRKYEVTRQAFQTWTRDFFRSDGRGLSVTSPHKQAAAALAAQLTPRASRAAAANTLSLRGDSIIGDNTDGAGLVHDLRDNLGMQITDKSLLILGAGGATRGVLAPLLALDPRFIVIANRTLDRAQVLAGQFGDLGSVRGCTFKDLEPRAFDVIINATDAGVAGGTPSLDARIVGPQTLCYDLAYGRGPTPFTAWAQQHGCAQAVKGWGTQVELAAEAFQLWHGVRPETASVIAILAADTL